MLRLHNPDPVRGLIYAFPQTSAVPTTAWLSGYVDNAAAAALPNPAPSVSTRDRWMPLITIRIA